MTDRRKTGAALFLALALSAWGAPAAAAAWTEDGNPDAKLDRAYLQRIPADCWTVWTAPARWRGRNFLTAAAVVGTTGLLLAFDGEIFDWIQEHKTTASVDASGIISKFGNGGYLAGFLAVLYGGGEIFDSRSLRKTALVGWESFLAAAGVVTAIKIVAGRARPYAGEGPDAFHPFSFQGKYASLVSADAATAFAVATAIDANSESFLIDALAYTAAGLAAFYRVHDRKHWPSDVLAGSAIGYFTARAICALNRGGDSVRISFEGGRDRRSVTLTFAF